MSLPVVPSQRGRAAPRSVRVSLTDRCDLACIYCRPHKQDGYTDDPMDDAAFEAVMRGLHRAGVRRVRVTGGEPLLFPRVVERVAVLARLGFEDLALTTNATRLESLARPLREAGLRRLTVSLDTLDPARFAAMTRGGKLDRVLAGIDAAVRAGFDELKLNAVVVRGWNDDEVEPLVRFAWARGITPRFIEVMRIGEGANLPEDAVVSRDELRAKLGALLADDVPTPDPDRGPARYVRAADGSGRRVGFISGTSDTFCEGCDRLRVSSEGMLRSCLATNDGVSARGSADAGDADGVARDLDAAWAQKPDGTTWKGCTESSAKSVSIRAIGGLPPPACRPFCYEAASMKKALLALPFLAACGSTPKTVREYVADGNLFDACVEAREHKSGKPEQDRKLVLGEALAGHGKVLVSARPLTTKEVEEKLGIDPFAGGNASLWVLRFEHELPRGHDVARLEMRLASQGKSGTLSITPQDRGIATSAIVIPPEPPAAPIPDLYTPVPDTDVTVPKPWEDPPPDEKKPPPKTKKPPKKPKKAEVEAWEKDVEKAKKKHNELEQAKVEASKKAQADALAARAKVIEEHAAMRRAREASAQKLSDLIREAKCTRDDEGFPVLRAGGVCEVVRIVTWTPGPKGARASLTLGHRISQGVQTCEGAEDRVLAADGDGPVETLLFAKPRPMSDFKHE